MTSMSDTLDREPFPLMKAAVMSCLRKEQGDVAEVEAIKRLIGPALAAQWSLDVSVAFRAWYDIVAEQRTRARDTRQEGDLALALLAALLERLRVPLPRVESKTVRAAARSLMSDGAYAVGRGSIQRLEVAGTMTSLLPLRAQQDLETLMIGRVIEHQDEVLEQVIRWSAGVIDPDSGDKILDALGAGPKNGPDSWLPYALDQWAYRWYNAGGYLAATEQGRALYYVNNPPNGPDERTTSFCRWIHGRAVDMGNSEDQLRETLQAAEKGAYEHLKESWPMHYFTRQSTPADYAAALKRSALPPFHPRCRTQLSTTRPA